MLYSDKRKRILSGWLKENDPRSYNSSLKLQKFLFFYEGLSKADGDTADFSGLKGYKKGPVFSSVWGDYTKDRKEFDKEAETSYRLNSKSVDESRARKINYLIASLSEEELSELTHQFNIWKAKSKEITSGIQQVKLSEDDFNSEDCNMMKKLEDIYTDQMVNNSVVVQVGEKYFIFPKKDAEGLMPQHYDILSELSNRDDLRNPVFAEIDETGGLLVD